MIKAILTDIEGTTTQLSFVKDVLFPYAYAHLPAYVEKNQNKPEVQLALNEARQILNDDSLTTAALIQQFLAWIEQDKKITPLKTLQGFIWQEGYQSGKLKSHVYPDAVAQLISWHKQGLTLAIFSSGSILAQKLLFGYTEYGDLTYLFSDYFDTTTGAKNAAQSYQKIAEQMRLPVNTILFLSDIPAELDAALAAGMHVFGLAREALPVSNHVFVKDFNAIKPEEI
jgi:enolase-phosphatase E1